MNIIFCVWLLQIRSPLSKNDRMKFNTVLIIDVHARDIIDSFVRDRFDYYYWNVRMSLGPFCYEALRNMNVMWLKYRGWRCLFTRFTHMLTGFQHWLLLKKKFLYLHLTLTCLSSFFSHFLKCQVSSMVSEYLLILLNMVGLIISAVYIKIIWYKVLLVLVTSWDKRMPLLSRAENMKFISWKLKLRCVHGKKLSSVFWWQVHHIDSHWHWMMWASVYPFSLKINDKD